MEMQSHHDLVPFSEAHAIANIEQWPEVVSARTVKNTSNALINHFIESVVEIMGRAHTAEQEFFRLTSLKHKIVKRYALMFAVGLVTAVGVVSLTFAGIFGIAKWFVLALSAGPILYALLYPVLKMFASLTNPDIITEQYHLSQLSSNTSISSLRASLEAERPAHPDSIRAADVPRYYH